MAYWFAATSDNKVTKNPEKSQLPQERANSVDAVNKTNQQNF